MFGCSELEQCQHLPKREAINELTIMGLVHDTKDDLGLALVLGSKLAPNAGELCVGRTSLSNDSSVPACIIVNVNDACSTSSKTGLNQLIIFAKVC